MRFGVKMGIGGILLIAVGGILPKNAYFPNSYAKLAAMPPCTCFPTFDSKPLFDLLTLFVWGCAAEGNFVAQLMTQPSDKLCLGKCACQTVGTARAICNAAGDEIDAEAKFRRNRCAERI
ncbi:hypothetical protein DFP92_101369 [Yoonia sediminilitoris]|uniref:Uncharacterized protein n=1 Tax=Yoonia sediminilitoris TaxID=1286148 RepID=A0A2T6KQF8_9RHOB|nr:hypothetical protein C8N45_101369 [Yoonia sediminilitoris]RCW98950.1 hypothetical protein DFP92_101369 [Yoonia sediminilitoris]